ncbi:AraC family transcriptional regulator [Marinomonas sp. THO17]|uniref:AraC family transcriptional regulator n=1 Tax=Marinomonas sp. THO17 TaxID=3149048 RepID=UPI00336C2BBB
MIPPRDIPTYSDTLGETLYSLRLNGLIYANSELTAPWGIAMPPLAGKMMFHIVTQGSCWLSFENGQSHFLQPGELALVPKGLGHSISHDKGQACEPFFDIPVTKLSERYEFLRYGGTGSEGEGEKKEKSHKDKPDQTQMTRLICGVLSFDHIAGQKLIAQLPEVIHLAKDNLSLSLQSMIHTLEQEAAALAPGGETIMTHLADIIVIQAIRNWISQNNSATSGWLRALQDPKLTKALSAIHTQPQQAWTVDKLAKLAGMSRSGFSAHFTQVIGTSVKHYLTEWRMNLARNKIQHTSVTLTDLAEELGYQSEAAFSRAYKRVLGEPPLRRKKSFNQAQDKQL